MQIYERHMPTIRQLPNSYGQNIYQRSRKSVPACYACADLAASAGKTIYSAVLMVPLSIRDCFLWWFRAAPGGLQRFKYEHYPPAPA